LNESPSPSRALPEVEGPAHTRLLQEDLLARIEACLANHPDAVELQVERAHLLADLKRPQEGAHAYRQAIKSRAPRYPLTTRAYSVLPYRGKTLPITVVLFVSPEWGNAPFRKYLDDQTFLTLQIIADFHDPRLSLPPHQLVINCISDADSCRTSLEAASALLKDTAVPTINSPSLVAATGRESHARLLGEIPGVRTPRMVTFSREILTGNHADETLRQHGFAFPLLLRSPGFHTGLHFGRVDSPQKLGAALADLPGNDICVVELLEAKSADGLVRKYRVMMIDGKFHPVHVAISREWKVHYFSAAMADFPEHRAEDRQFLENMADVLGAGIMESLARIRDILKLDYAGVDFSIGPDGGMLLFEANATMNIAPPDADEMWAYRREPVRRIEEAVRTLFFTRAFSSSHSMPTSSSQVLREFTLRNLDARLEREPELIELQIDRARLLIEMERLDEARQIYLNILIKDPTHLVALNNLAALFNMTGHHSTALKINRAVLALNPDNLKARVNLADNLRESAELEEARLQYETILRGAPDLPEAHLGLAYVLRYLREDATAWEHWKKGAGKHPPTNFPSRDQKDLIRILLLTSPCGGNAPLARLLDKKTFVTLGINPDFYDPAVPVPPHHLVLNTIGDADHCTTSLEATGRILEQTTAPVLNLPARVQATGRVDNARLLGALEGVVTPRIVTFDRETLAGPDAVVALDEHGLAFPILLRAPGFHGGSHFVRVENPSDLAPAVASLPGRKPMAIQYLDARDADGKIRKYRVMMIDGKLLPLHKAVSPKWMIHYYSAEMTESSEHRAEDEAFLEDMPKILGPRAMRALERIRDALGLDYAGADFSLSREGEILLFEANATMVVPEPGRGEKWDYRRRAVRQIHEAVRAMVRRRALGETISGSGNPPVDNAKT
jgi:tetratricopeptide (TPR) repeat protein